MAVKKSAKKAAKRALKNREVNLQFKIVMKKAVKNFLKALDMGIPTEELKVKLSNAYSAIDKAAKRGVIKKQAAARKKSRLAGKLVASL
jgi:small subunit ribosomal protein S20